MRAIFCPPSFCSTWCRSRSSRSAIGKANYYNFEPPLIALLDGLVLSNAVGLPRGLDAGFRVQFYIKTGIVLLGATLPHADHLGGLGGDPQASIVSIATFLVIYWVAVKLRLDKRLAATLGAGGAIPRPGRCSMPARA